MKKIFVVSYIFPPMGGAGVQRTAKFVKYLARIGWQSTVITCTGSTRIVDNSISKDIPLETRVVRAWSLISPRSPTRLRSWLSKWILIVDAELGWFPFAFYLAKKILRKDKHSIIYSTSGPVTNHIIGLKLKRIFHLPWVADFRDPWVQNINADFPTRFHKNIASRIERSIIENADRVIVVSEPMRQQFIKEYSHVSKDRFFVIPNGYDAEDYSESTSSLDLKLDKFNLIYTGSIYKPRSAKPLLTAIRRLIDRKKIDPGKICLLFIGSHGKETADSVAELNLSHVARLINYRPHDEIVSYQLAATALLLIMGDGVGSDAYYSGKIFEYLYLNKPILSLVPNGAAKDLLIKAGNNYIAHPDDVDGIAESLINLYEHWFDRRLQFSLDRNVVNRYDRRLLTGQLAAIFDNLIGSQEI